MMNAIDFAPCHRLPGRLRLCLLTAEDVPHFFIQFIRSLMEQFEIASFDLRPCRLAQVPSKPSFDKCRPPLFRSCPAMDVFSLHIFHTTNMPA